MGRVGVITSHLAVAFGQPSGMASSSISETGMASFIIMGGIIAMPVSAITIAPLREKTGVQSIASHRT